jgi:hypothetical protein
MNACRWASGSGGFLCGVQQDKTKEIEMAYKWYEATSRRFRAEYAPYDTRSEFDEGMQAFEFGIWVCPYEGPEHPKYQALAWEKGLECAVRLRYWFKFSRKLPVFGDA